MKRITLRHNVAQFAIDLLFGVALLTPLVYGIASNNQYTAILLTIGVGIGYSLHMVQKVLLYEELLSEEVRTHVETEVEQTVPERTEAEVKEQVKEQVEQQVDVDDGKTVMR